METLQHTLSATTPSSRLLRAEPQYSTLSSIEKTKQIVAVLEKQQATQIKALNVSGKSACMDVVVIATAKSARHARSLADSLSELASTENLEWLRLEGYQNAEWILADMNDVIVHIFQPETRDMFQLENLWKGAPTVLNTDCTNELTPTLLLILDGYGLAESGAGNAESIAVTPHLDRLMALPECTQLHASGRAVGLPDGYMGNSEVGHLNIGAGRIVYQDMTRIDVAIENNELATNSTLVDMFAKVKAAGGRIHFAGLLSDGGVHSHIQHLAALLQLAQQADVPALVHAFLDGRDTPPTSAAHFVQQLQPHLAATGATLATITGRFYAMDRDKRWERVHEAWNLLVHGIGQQEINPVTALENAYAQGETDEFIKPRLILDANTDCQTTQTIKDNDGIFFFNFRADRARELVSAFVLDEFSGFERSKRPQLSAVASMTAYDSSFTFPVVFEKDNLTNTLGACVANLGLTQLRIAETEKYAHVTYFFNGGREEPFIGEERMLINSPKDVDTYDQKPQMSAEEVTDKLLEAFASKRYSFIVCNLANPDMVGHTGNIPATVAALETVDACVGRIVAATTAAGTRLLLTADHGNAEQMIDPETGEPHTAHTCNPVPLLLLEKGEPVLLEAGKLADIAPTILHLWNQPLPDEMSGLPLTVTPKVLP